MKETKDSAFSLRGEVIIKDANTGKVLVHKHNMIVNDGLDFIRWTILNRLGLLDENTSNNSLKALNTKYNNKTISLCVNFGTSIKDSVPSMKSLDSDSVKKIEIDKSKVTYNTTKNRLELTISAISEANGNQKYISELGIFLKTKGTNNDGSASSSEPETMFSRVTFDPIMFSESTPFTLTYYIYL